MPVSYSVKCFFFCRHNVRKWSTFQQCFSSRCRFVHAASKRFPSKRPSARCRPRTTCLFSCKPLTCQMALPSGFFGALQLLIFLLHQKVPLSIYQFFNFQKDVFQAGFLCEAAFIRLNIF